jgi:hypothetical protein
MIVYLLRLLTIFEEIATLQLHFRKRLMMIQKIVVDRFLVLTHLYIPHSKHLIPDMSSRTIVRPVRHVPRSIVRVVRVSFISSKYSNESIVLGVLPVRGVLGVRGASSPAFLRNKSVDCLSNHRAHTAKSTLHTIFHGELTQLF